MLQLFHNTKAAFLCLMVVALLLSRICNAQSTTCRPSINIVHQVHTLCNPNAPTVFNATAVDAGSSPVYQWKKNGIPVGTNSPEFSGLLTLGDEVVCELTTTGCTNNVTVVSNRFRFEPIDRKEPEVTIVASSTRICSGASVTFTATNKSGNTNPAFQWFVNNNAIEGTNSPVFTTSDLSEGAAVQCRMTVTQCFGQQTGSTKDYSDAVIIQVRPALQPSISIATAATDVCKGTAVTFTATAANAGNNPLYTWKVNGVATPAEGKSFTTADLKQGDKVSCAVSVHAAENCGQSVPAISNVLEMQVRDVPVPSVAITASEQVICFGKPVAFQAVVHNGGIDPVQYQWQVNGKAVGNNLPQFRDSLLNNGDVVSCLVSTATSCGNVVVPSNEIVTSVLYPPQIDLAEDTIIIWAGEQARLQAKVTGPVAAYRWTPADKLVHAQTLEPLTRPLEANAEFRLEAAAENGCRAIGPVWVLVKRRLFLPNAFTPDGDGLNDVFRVPPGVPLELDGFSVYDRWGNRLFFTRNTALGWDGRIRGRQAPAGVYTYLIQGRYDGRQILLKGSIVLAK